MKALLIGINYTGTSSQLNGCINDVIHMNEHLKTHGYTDIKMLRDDLSAENKPTYDNIIAGFKWLTDGATADSRLFVHYSGHGSYIADKSGDEIDGNDECICPLDYNSAGFIIDDDLKRYLVDPLPAGAKLNALFDCCHSGTVLDLKYNVKVRLQGRKTRINIDIDNHYTDSNADICLFSGCKDNQTSADAWEERKFQGAMTFGYLKTYIDGITYSDFITKLTAFLKSSGYQQIPQMSTGRQLNINSVYTP